ncbi:hypothetical protein [Sphingobium sp. BS19]|uniref:hypothetical protein n=1 Tax=Sphingobium sp. BS19 TaxID=3018973 RepID=UPI0022EFBEBA|nr:hypothetical protein [Sphingobium sp. BS19]GLI99468.1 hypothetical protein Sbs19_32860 [Sphingobium sp. BS19]
MWLIDRGSEGRSSRHIALPIPVREALVRWYAGHGSCADEETGIVLVQQARLGRKWIACDCLPAGEAPPVLTPAFLSEAETYYLRRLTGRDRPEHHPDCPFFREQATNRISEVRGHHAPADPPTGFFEVLRPAPEKLAQRPNEEANDDRTRQASVPRLARLLWRLIDVAGLNHCPCLSADSDQRSIGDEFRTLTSVTGAIMLAPGIELGRAFWTHPQALHSRRVYGGLRALARHWPRGHAPQAFLALFAHHVRGSTVYVADGDPVTLANRVQSPSTRDNPIDGPYLVIIVVGQFPEAHGYAPLRGYAQPILSGHRFIPVETAFEREALHALIDIRRAFERRGIELFIEKPVFDILTPLGPCRPAFLIEARSRATGECRQIAVELVACLSDSEAHARTRMRDQVKQIAPIVTLSPADIAPEKLVYRLSAAFNL